MNTHKAAWLRLLVRPWLVVLLLCVGYLLVIDRHYHNGLWEFIRPTPSGDGYDGQFTYCIALDPTPRSAALCLDVPAYRYQRILHPLLARLLGLGDSFYIMWAVLGVAIAMLVVGTWATETLLVGEKTNRWYALIYGLFGGLFFAVRATTTEPLAYGLVMLSLVAAQRNRWTLHALGLGLAAFAKETTLLFAFSYLAWFVLTNHWKEAIRLTVLAILPFGAWQLVLRAWFGGFGVGSGGAMATPFEILPFMGLMRIWTEGGAKVFLLLGGLSLVFCVLPVLWSLWHSLRDILTQRWHPYVFMLAFNAIILPFVPFSTFREPFGLARFMPGLMITVLAYAAWRRNRRVLMYSTLWLVWGLLLLG